MEIFRDSSERYVKWLVILLSTFSHTRGQPGKCDQTPPMTIISTPSEETGIYHLNIQHAGTTDGPGGKMFYTPDQTYVLTITTSNLNRPFKWFMITAEDPEVDNKIYDFGTKQVPVGSLKTLDTDHKSQHSDRCYSSVESADYSDKTSVEIHWVSPKQSPGQKIRIRATVAENNEAWYEGPELTVILHKNNKKSLDSPPIEPIKTCNLCSEARYEVIFNGKWSRMAHPRLYPSKPDENGYSHMVGCSHDYNYTLWQQGSAATDGLKLLAEESNTTVMEAAIVKDMGVKMGTRTLIRGKRRHHPWMFEPSHSLFRVDRYHHLFSLVVGMRPSPDWFLGTSRFELCTPEGWLQTGEIPMYPWDAGTMDGVSYESTKSKTNPVDTIERVEVGSFNRDSPFYQMNLNDLKPFAMLTVNRLDVYPLMTTDCTEEGAEEAQEEVMDRSMGNAQEEEGEPQDEPEEPTVGESKLNLEGSRDCYIGQWGVWSPCTADDGVCGNGFTTRARYRGDRRSFKSYDHLDSHQAQPTSSCDDEPDARLVEYKNCFVNCY